MSTETNPGTGASSSAPPRGAWLRDLKDRLKDRLVLEDGREVGGVAWCALVVELFHQRFDLAVPWLDAFGSAFVTVLMAAVGILGLIVLGKPDPLRQLSWRSLFIGAPLVSLAVVLPGAVLWSVFSEPEWPARFAELRRFVSLPLVAHAARALAVLAIVRAVCSVTMAERILSPGGQDAISQRFGFEHYTQLRDPRRKSHRKDGDRDEARCLLRRLGAPEAEMDWLLEARDLGPLLLRHAQEYQLNIYWYERELARKQRMQMMFTAVVTGLGIAGIGLTVLFARDSKWEASIALIIGGVLGALQLLANILDLKTQIGIFWEASSRLKERLYRFEDDWRGRVSQGSGALEQFRGALRRQLRAAREVSAREQAAFFASLKTPHDVASAVTSILGQVRSQRAEFAAADASQEATGALSPWEQLETARSRIATLEAQNAPAEELKQAKMAAEIAERLVLANVLSTG